MGCPLFWGGGESGESLHRFSALASDSRAFHKVASPLWDRERREKKSVAGEHTFHVAGGGNTPDFRMNTILMAQR